MNSLCQDTSSKKISEHRLKSQDKSERRAAGEGDKHCANKPHKRVHPVCVDRESKIRKESEAEFLKHTNTFLPNKYEEHGNQTVFEKFLELCWQKSNSPEMKVILQKAQNYYAKARPDYTSSVEFQNLVTSKMNDIVKRPCSIYVFMKDVIDEIKARRLKKHKPSSKRHKASNGSVHISSNSDGAEPGPSGHTKEEDEDKARRDALEAMVNFAESANKDRQIKKLSKIVMKLQIMIQRLEEKEVDFDDESDSSYIRLQRYRERFCKVHEKLCELTGDSVAYKGNRRRIAFSGTDSSDINRCIEKFVNKTGQFPDFHDILSLVKSVQSDVNMKPETLRRIAEDAFLSLGQQLQRQRQYEAWNSVSVFLKDQPDPAESNAELQSMLQNNATEYTARMQNVIDSFAERQIAEKLVAEEVPDEDANKSEESEPDESEKEREGEEEKDFVEKVLKGEENVTSDEEMEIESHEENKKCDVLSDEDDDYKSSHAFTDDEGERNLEETSKYINREDSCTVPTENHQLSPSVLDVHRTGCCGPVSPPVLGEDLSNRELHYAKLPSSKEDGSSEEKEMESNILSDAECRLSSPHCDQHNIFASESPLSITHPSVSKSPTLPGGTDEDCLSHISGQNDTASSDYAHIQSTNLQVCEKSKPETSSASIIVGDESSSSSLQKQSDEPKSQTPLPTFSTENDTDNLDEDRTSPSLLEHLNASQLDSISENSEISGRVTTQLTNVNNTREKSDHAEHTTHLIRNEFISNKFMVTQMEAGSGAVSGISRVSDTGKRGKLIMRKFVRTMSVSSFDKQKHGMKSVSPDVITLE
jgi:hypothetical protein